MDDCNTVVHIYYFSQQPWLIIFLHYTQSTSRIGFLALRNSRGWAIVSDPILVKYGVTYDRPSTRLSLCQKPILEVDWVYIPRLNLPGIVQVSKLKTQPRTFAVAKASKSTCRSTSVIACSILGVSFNRIFAM